MTVTPPQVGDSVLGTSGLYAVSQHFLHPRLPFSKPCANAYLQGLSLKTVDLSQILFSQPLTGVRKIIENFKVNQLQRTGICKDANKLEHSCPV